MKTLLKKLLFWDNPGKGLVFALSLSSFGSCLVWEWGVLAGGLMPLFMGVIALFWHVALFAEHSLTALAWFALPLIFLLYLLIQLIHNLCRYRMQIFRQWRWLLLMTVLIALGAWGTALAIVRLLAWDGVMSCCGDTAALEICSRFPSPWWPYLGVAAWFGLVFVAGKIAADLAQTPYRKMFGTATLAVLALFAATYAVSACLALHASRKTAVCVAETERFFGAPLTAEALETDFYRTGKPDAAFWQKADEFEKALTEELGEETARKIYDDKLPDDDVVALGQTLAAARNYARWEALYSRPLPLPERRYQRGRLAESLLTGFAGCRQFCRLERFAIRYAIVRKDKPAALAALRRMDHVDHFLRHDSTLVSGLVWIAIEKTRLEGVVLLLNSGLLTSDELKQEKARLENSLSALPEIHRRSIYGEAVFADDWCTMFTDGCILPANGKFHGGYLPGLYPLRWLSPALWRTMTRNREILIRTYQVNDFTQVNDRHGERSDRVWLAWMLLPSLPNAGEHFHELEMRYEIVKTLYELAIRRQETGKIPERFELPRDWFGTGKCLCRKAPESGRVTIWSIGRNRRDDNAKFDLASDADDIAYHLDRPEEGDGE